MTPHLARSTTAVDGQPNRVKSPATSRYGLVARFLSREGAFLPYFLAVATLLIVALLLRTWGIDFGLPFIVHPDEEAIVERSLAIIRTGDFNPHWFRYPSLYIYVQAAADILVFLSSAEKLSESITLPLTPVYEYMRFGRLITAIIGTATVLVVYYTGRALFSARIGLLAAAFLTFSLLHTIHSHYITTDVPLALFTTLSLLMSALVLRTGKSKYYLLAGLTAGLAASTKYNGAIALSSLIAAHSFVAWRQRSAITLAAVGALAAFAAGFLWGTPYAILDLPGFLRDLAFEIAHYRSGQPGFEGDNNLQWYLTTVLGGWDGVVLVFALAGAAICLASRRASSYLILAFPATYIWWISGFAVRFERNLATLAPFLALLAAVFVDWQGSKLAPNWNWFRLLSPFFSAALLALALIPSLTGIVQFDELLSARHPKNIAADWANSSLPRGAKIAVEFYGIPLDSRAFDLVNVSYVVDFSAEWFLEQNFDYVVISDGLWTRYFMEPDKYQKEVAAYNSIFGKLKLVKAIDMAPPYARLVFYPTVEVYHLPQVRIYKVEEAEK